MYCKNCGNELKPGTKYCNKCGALIEQQLNIPKKKNISWIVIASFCGIIVFLICIGLGVAMMFKLNHGIDTVMDEEKSEEMTIDEIEKEESESIEEKNTQTEEESLESTVDISEWMNIYDERMNEIRNESYYMPEYNRCSLIYLDNDTIPECIIWSIPYMSYDETEVYGYRQITVLSYKDGSLYEYASEESGCDTQFYYNEKEGSFQLIEILGLRSATWYEMVRLKGDFECVAKAYIDNDIEGNYYYGINDEDVEEAEYNSVLDSFTYELELTENDQYESLENAYEALDNGATGSEIIAEAEENSISDSNTADITADIDQIREWYNETQNNLDTYMQGGEYADGFSEVIDSYYAEGFPIKMIVNKGQNGWNKTRWYFYHDKKLYFAFVFDGKDEERYYFKNDEMIRYIDNLKNTYDLESATEFQDKADKVLEEAYIIYPEMVNCGA